MKTNLKLANVLTMNPETYVMIEEKVKTVRENDLIIYNDDVNTFAHVIGSLVDVCSHDWLQAEQCAQIIHGNGKCSVRRGSYKKLKPLCEALLDRHLSATIE